ncbi:hypothetical protein GW17_00005020 [Ensete ventricosum]|uniref:Uncharacterized protein n=1 Tax=Ensete ventricosum TaxID=4639 RepID=A0A427A258_ENSVE|nr:hypothetical protein B296_00022209 [Ensete ventricosum]RWW30409.1 hypothetical protein GW17_00005020 [Ensete ventricosum]
MLVPLICRHLSSQPWIFTEIKEQRHWDISSWERFNILKDFVQFGLQHWGSDTKGMLLPLKETNLICNTQESRIRISEMLLGKIPEDFTFTPKHKSNAYDSAENG